MEVLYRLPLKDSSNMNFHFMHSEVLADAIPKANQKNYSCKNVAIHIKKETMNEIENFLSALISPPLLVSHLMQPQECRAVSIHKCP